VDPDPTSQKTHLDQEYKTAVGQAHEELHMGCGRIDRIAVSDPAEGSMFLRNVDNQPYNMCIRPLLLPCSRHRADGTRRVASRSGTAAEGQLQQSVAISTRGLSRPVADLVSEARYSNTQTVVSHRDSRGFVQVLPPISIVWGATLFIFPTYTCL
jgi:hypothetical protein